MNEEGYVKTRRGKVVLGEILLLGNQQIKEGVITYQPSQIDETGIMIR